MIKALAEHWYVNVYTPTFMECTCQNRGMHTHYGNPYLSVNTLAFLGKYQSKGVILVVVFLLSEKVINRTHRSEPFLTVHTMELASDQKPEAAQD